MNTAISYVDEDLRQLHAIRAKWRMGTDLSMKEVAWVLNVLDANLCARRVQLGVAPQVKSVRR